METASTLMGLGLFILFIAPVGYVLYDQSLKEKKRAKKLALLTHQQGLSLDETENIRGLSLGLDRKSKKFILLKSGDKAKLQIIDLEKVRNIELSKTDEDGRIISSLDEVREISLKVKSKDETINKIIFYAEEEDPVTQKDERLANALKWESILKQQIK